MNNLYVVWVIRHMELEFGGGASSHPGPHGQQRYVNTKYSSRLTASTLDSVAILSQVPVPLAFIGIVLATTLDLTDEHFLTCSNLLMWYYNFDRILSIGVQMGPWKFLQWPRFALMLIAWASTTSKSIYCTYKFHSQGLQPIWKATASWGDCHNLATVETSNLCNVKFYRSSNVNKLTQTCISSGSAFTSGSMQDRWLHLSTSPLCLGYETHN